VFYTVNRTAPDDVYLIARVLFSFRNWLSTFTRRMAVGATQTRRHLSYNTITDVFTLPRYI